MVGRRRRRGDRFRYWGWLRSSERGRRRRTSLGAGARSCGRWHHVACRGALLPRRRHRGPAGHRASRLARGDVQVSGRGVAPTRPREDSRLLRRQRRALQLVGGLGFSVRAKLLPGQGGRSTGYGRLELYRQRKGVAVLRAGQTLAARALGAGAGRARRCVHGDRPAGQTRRRPGSADPIRDWGNQPDPGRRRRRGRRRLEAIHRNRCGQSQISHHCRGRFRDEPGDGRRTYARAGPAAAYQAPWPRCALHPGQPQRRRTGPADGRLGRRRRREHERKVHHRGGLSARNPADGCDREQGGQALRRRGLLPLAHIGFRVGAAGTDRIPDR